MSEVVSIPQLRFPEFRDEWRVDKFVDLCKFQQGVQVDVELQSTEPKNNFLRFLRIENYTQKSNDFRYIPKELSSNKSITENEIAIVRYGATAGYIGRGLKGVLANNLFKLVLNKDTLDTDYLFHLLRSYKTFCFFQSEMSGGAMPALSFGIVGALKLPYSSISEQQKIAAFLTVVDNKIEQLSKKQELLGEYKKGLMQQIFSQAIRFKADDGSDFPDWEEVKLGNIGEFKTSSVDKKIVEGQKLIQLVNYMNVYKHENIKNNSTKDLMIVSANETQLNASDLKKGDILFTPSSETPDDIGHSVVIFEDLMDTLYSYHLMRFRPKVQLDILYSHYFCNIPDVLRQISRVATGSTRFTISVGEFSKIQINLPSLLEQTKIANFLSAIDNKIEKVGKQLVESKQFKKALLQQMFV